MRTATTVSGASHVLGLAFALSLSMIGRSDAAPIFTGDGATAWVDALGSRDSRNDGAPASVSGATTIQYTKAPSLEPGSVPASYSASALSNPSATGGALLELFGSASSPDPGRTVGPRHPGPYVDLGATWTGVIAKVDGPSGAALPGSIRLGFDLAYTRPSDIQEEDWGFNQYMIRTQTLNISGAEYKLPGEGGRILEDQGAVVLGEDGLLHLNFGLTLALSETGESDPFSISLATHLAAMIASTSIDNASVSSLSFNSITLPDGANLEAAGYSVTFDSGNPMPPIIPEPTTWLAWSLLAAGSARAFRRLRAA